MLLILAAGFVAMAAYRQSQALVMPLVAAAFLLLQGTGAQTAVLHGFEEFAGVAMIFTAIAIPTHLLQKSGVFDSIAAQLGNVIGLGGLRFPRLQISIVVALCLLLTWATAALLHNITGIFIMTPVIITLCMSYGIPSHWLLCGALVASNLGGFSIATADTPNIIEARVWGLRAGDFITEILPLNLAFLALLIGGVILLTQFTFATQGRKVSLGETARGAARWRRAALETQIDYRLLLGGGLVLGGFILIQVGAHEWELAAAAAAILLGTLGERPRHRLKTLQALGLDVYLTLVSVFIIAYCIGESVWGRLLEDLIASTDGALWAISVSSYVGTALTEAASWAATAAPIVHEIDGSHAAAWALGAGICAGSSSVLTAASAGIILWTESRRFPGHEVTFAGYVGFGLVASLSMLGFYIAVLTVLRALGAW